MAIKTACPSSPSSACLAATERRNKTSNPRDFDKAIQVIDESLRRVELKNPLIQHKTDIGNVKVERLDCSFGVVRVDGDPLPLRRAVKTERRIQGAAATIVFAIRRPGCGNCREHASQLVELAKNFDDKVALVGVVKEIGVADVELDNFYQNYFRRPIYRDPDWKVYHMMGNRRLSIVSLLMGHLKNLRRYKRKKIENVPFGGDLFTQGGLLIFDKKGELRYAYDEVFGEELNITAISTALDLVL